jgi:hypothetical protein
MEHVVLNTLRMETARPRAVARRREGAPAPGIVVEEANPPLALLLADFVAQPTQGRSRATVKPRVSQMNQGLGSGVGRALGVG